MSLLKSVNIPWQEYEHCVFVGQTVSNLGDKSESTGNCSWLQATKIIVRV